MSETVQQTPEADLDWERSWSTYLQTGETISTSTFTAETIEGFGTITLHTPTNTTTTTTIWASGGTLHAVYKITNTIVTSDSRTDSRHFYLSIVEKCE